MGELQCVRRILKLVCRCVSIRYSRRNWRSDGRLAVPRCRVKDMCRVLFVSRRNRLFSAFDLDVTATLLLLPAMGVQAPGR